MTYSIENGCGTKEDLAELSPEELADLEDRDEVDPGLIEQVSIKDITQRYCIDISFQVL